MQKSPTNAAANAAAIVARTRVLIFREFPDQTGNRGPPTAAKFGFPIVGRIGWPGKTIRKNCEQRADSSMLVKIAGR